MSTTGSTTNIIRFTGIETTIRFNAYESQSSVMFASKVYAQVPDSHEYHFPKARESSVSSSPVVKSNLYKYLPRLANVAQTLSDTDRASHTSQNERRVNTPPESETSNEVRDHRPSPQFTISD